MNAICIYKLEESPIITDLGSRLDGTALKLCTFKVGEAVRGRKLGERLLYCAFKYAVRKNCPYVYLHIFGEHHEMLVSLCKEYGFLSVGKYRERDRAFLKQMHPLESPDNELDPLIYAIRYYPNYLDTPLVKKFIIPIRPEFHEILFVDQSSFAKSLFADQPDQYMSESNTIKKAYICHSNINQIRRGDLLLFYRTQDRKSIECIGVAEQAYRGRDINKVLAMVSKRTVYSEKEIGKWLKKDTLVILFRYLHSIQPVTHTMLSQAEIHGPIQTIREISHEQFQKCFKRSQVTT